jgi:cyclic nucleotide-binding protein/MFS transporter
VKELRATLRSPAIRRVVLAFATFNFAEWATWTAVLVYAFERGGATESGLVAFTMLVPAAVVAPVVASIGGRYRRERQLLAAYVTQAVVMTAGAFAFAIDAPPVVLYALATLTSMSVTLTRPAHGSILPSLATTPDELTAANVASGTVQNISIAIAPFAAGLIYADSGPATVFAVCAAGVALGGALVARVRTATDEEPAGEPAIGATVHAAEPGSTPGDPLDGLRYLGRAPGPRLVVGLIGAAAVIEGALDVLMIVVAIELAGAGPAEAGALSSAAGVGGILGAAAAVALVGRPRLAGPFALGLIVWGAPVALLGIAPGIVAGLAVFVIAGIGRGGLDVAGRTLLQRVTPDPALPGVFGVLEGTYMAMIAVGSVAVPFVIVLLGAHAALVVVGLWLPLVVAVAWNRLRAVDAAAVVHVRELGLLRAIPMFAPLAPPTIERLAANLLPVEVTAGTWIIREGERGDRFYVVDEGQVEVEIDGEAVRSQGPGSSFGEIALLRDVPRTASVRAATDVRLLALERDVFLSAVTGHTRSRAAAEAVVAERLGSG